MRKPAAARSLQPTGQPSTTPGGSSSSDSPEAHPGGQSNLKQFEASLNKLVEGRVRRSLQAVRAGQATPQQALQSAVQQLAAELSEQQFSTIVDYFAAKHTQGQLSGAKQLLLQALCTVKQQQQQPHRQDQQQAKLCPDPGSLLSSKTPAPGTVSPAFQQPQHQHHHQQHHQHHQQAFPGLTAAARDTQDVRRSRDQSTPPGPFQHLQQLTSAQQQEQQQQQYKQGAQQSPSTNRQQQGAPASAAAAADGGKCQAFKQGLLPLQV